MSIHSDFDWFIVHHFNQIVNNNKNRIIVVSFLVGG